MFIETVDTTDTSALATIEAATMDDLPEIEEMICDYLMERYAGGSDVIPNDRSVGFNVVVARSILSGAMDGAVSIARGAGVDIAVDALLPWDSVHGKTATSCFTYVKPQARGNGLAVRLRAATDEALRAKGYDALIAGVDVSNEAGMRAAKKAGDKPYQINCVRFLNRKENN